MSSGACCWGCHLASGQKRPSKQTAPTQGTLKFQVLACTKLKSCVHQCILQTKLLELVSRHPRSRCWQYGVNFVFAFCPCRLFVVCNLCINRPFEFTVGPSSVKAYFQKKPPPCGTCRLNSSDFHTKGRCDQRFMSVAAGEWRHGAARSMERKVKRILTHPKRGPQPSNRGGSYHMDSNLLIELSFPRGPQMRHAESLEGC